ncbi:hypothetical protein BLNAU_2233 [Blattamonas nauphoetae]|uniref:Uncharacterized protein n=1 Tax=Blattamonas nauphoetae TaxID=2049346 RepID=A0ABQ9YGG8_9EUKA|nr:hypothetical protein BLNAU_2233 [Blattamonas nauphoetae]
MTEYVVLSPFPSVKDQESLSFLLNEAKARNITKIMISLNDLDNWDLISPMVKSDSLLSTGFIIGTYRIDPHPAEPSPEPRPFTRQEFNDLLDSFSSTLITAVYSLDVPISLLVVDCESLFSHFGELTEQSDLVQSVLTSLMHYLDYQITLNRIQSYGLTNISSEQLHHLMKFAKSIKIAPPSAVYYQQAHGVPSTNVLALQQWTFPPITIVPADPEEEEYQILWPPDALLLTDLMDLLPPEQEATFNSGQKLVHEEASRHHISPQVMLTTIALKHPLKPSFPITPPPSPAGGQPSDVPSSASLVRHAETHVESTDAMDDWKQSVIQWFNQIVNGVNGASDFPQDAAQLFFSGDHPRRNHNCAIF